jgi:hypothetical protein
MSKRTPEEVLNEIESWDDGESDPEVDEAVDVEMARVLAMTPEERARELRAAGVDIEAERAKADAWLEKAKGAAVAPEDAPSRGDARPRGRFAIRTIALLAAAIVGVLAGVFVVPRFTGAGGDVASPPPSAAQLREKAFAACEAQKWNECLDLLDKARAKDPAGEADERVQLLRRTAQHPVRQ